MRPTGGRGEQGNIKLHGRCNIFINAFNDKTTLVVVVIEIILNTGVVGPHWPSPPRRLCRVALRTFLADEALACCCCCC